MNPILEVSNIKISYDNCVIIEDLSVKKGKWVGQIQQHSYNFNPIRIIIKQSDNKKTINRFYNTNNWGFIQNKQRCLICLKRDI